MTEREKIIDTINHYKEYAKGFSTGLDHEFQFLTIGKWIKIYEKKLEKLDNGQA